MAYDNKSRTLVSKYGITAHQPWEETNKRKIKSTAKVRAAQLKEWREDWLKTYDILNNPTSTVEQITQACAHLAELSNERP